MFHRDLASARTVISGSFFPAPEVRVRRSFFSFFPRCRLLFLLLCLCTFFSFYPILSLEAETTEPTRVDADDPVFPPARSEEALFPPLMSASDRGIYSVTVLAGVQKDGSARIREYWQVCFPDAKHTELYIPKRFNDVRLHDEHVQVRAWPIRTLAARRLPPASPADTMFEDVGRSWNVKGSFENKKGKNGLHVASNGDLEICVGLTYREATLFEISYQLDSFVKQYKDGITGANIRFINDHLDPPPRYALVHIYMEDGTPLSTANNAKIWAFGFVGKAGTLSDETGLVCPASSHLAAQNMKSFSSGDHMTLLFSIAAPGLRPTTVVPDKSFEDVKKTAFKDSSFLSEISSQEILKHVFLFFFRYPYLFFCLLYLLLKPFFGGSSRANRRLRIFYFTNRAAVSPPPAPSSSPPFEGKIHSIYYCSAQIPRRRNKNRFDGKNVLAALLLRWVRDGYLCPRVPLKNNGEKDYKNTQLQLLSSPNFFENCDEEHFWGELVQIAERDDHALIDRAAVKAHFARKAKSLEAFLAEIHQIALTELTADEYCTSLSSKKYALSERGLREAQNMLAFRDFVQNYSLLNTREAYEASLWDELLISATACGLGKTALEQMRQLVPEYCFAGDLYGADMFDALYFMQMIDHMAYHSGCGAVNERRSAAVSRGFGGFSSLGGGGGFSGGSSGGGAR